MERSICYLLSIIVMQSARAMDQQKAESPAITRLRNSGTHSAQFCKEENIGTGTLIIPSPSFQRKDSVAPSVVDNSFNALTAATLTAAALALADSRTPPAKSFRQRWTKKIVPIIASDDAILP